MHFPRREANDSIAGSSREKRRDVIDFDFRRCVEKVVPRAALPHGIRTVGFRAVWPLVGARWNGSYTQRGTSRRSALVLEGLLKGGREAMNVEGTAPFAERRGDANHDTVKTPSSEERLLVAQAKSGRSIAFGELYERHRLRIYRTAFRILRNRQDAEDAVQLSFQRAFINLARFREDSAFLTWVTRIAINEALMLLRRKRANKPLPEENFDYTEGLFIVDLEDERPTPEQVLAENELHAALTHAISQLRESLRTVVLLHELQQLRSTETARRLGLTVSAVKGRIFHARRHLRLDLERKLQASLQ